MLETKDNVGETIQPVQKNTPPIEVTKTKNDAPPPVKKKKVLIIKNSLGEEISPKDYFYSSKGLDAAPTWFEKVCGTPVDREDMLAVFHKIFKPSDGFLFYKAPNKEVYVIIVPLKYSDIVGLEHDSVEGDFQRHAISFISEGSVNIDTLRIKLQKVRGTIKTVDR
jgi:hypothetical protein